MGILIINKKADFSSRALGKIITPDLFMTATQITNSVKVDAVTRLVDDLVVAGIWRKFHAIYPFVGGTPDAHKFNLKDPRDLDAAYRIAFTGGVHNELGFNGNGGGYGNTFILPTLYTGKGFGMYNTGPQIGEGIPFGLLTSTGGTQFKITRNLSGQTNSTQGGSSATASATGYDLTKKGHLYSQRLSLTDLKLYDNGLQIATRATAVTENIGANVNPFHIGMIKNQAGEMQYASNVPLGLIHYNDAMTVPEIEAMSNAFIAFQTALGRA